MTGYEQNKKDIKALLKMLQGKLCHAFEEQDKGNEEPFEALYNEEFTLSFMGKCCKLYFGATECQLIEEMLQTILEEY